MKCISKGVHKITFNGRLIRFLWGIGETLGLNWLRLWLGAWQHQAITWTNAEDVVDENHDLKSDTYILHYYILIKCVDTGVAGIMLGMDSDQWKEALHSDASSHWLNPYSEWSLCWFKARLGVKAFSEEFILILNKINWWKLCFW